MMMMMMIHTRLSKQAALRVSSVRPFVRLSVTYELLAGKQNTRKKSA